MNPAKLWFYLRNLLFAYLAVKRLYLFFAEGRIIDLMVGLLFVGLVIYDLRSAFSQKQHYSNHPLVLPQSTSG